MSTSLNLDQSISLLNCDACQVRPYSNSLAFGQLDVSDTRQPCKHAGALMANWLQTLKIDSQPLATGQLDISDNCQLYKARPQYGYNHHNSQLIITSTGSAPVWSRRRRPYLSLADVPAIRLLPPTHTELSCSSSSSTLDSSSSLIAQKDITRQRTSTLSTGDVFFWPVI